MRPHGKITARALEAFKSAQTGGQDIQTSHLRAKIGRQGARPPRRPPLSQPRGQHAHGSEEKHQGESLKVHSEDSEEDAQDRCAQNHRAENCKGPPEKDPRGGLTAAGRKAFARKQGAHLRPGVTKRDSEMTPQEMRRKGSWAVRFYGRAKLPALVDARGRPRRHALSAHAWGEPVPKTVAAARRIAARGERLLARYRRIKDRAE
ncbi:DUF6321 domain-containing protein [uncultured Bradyrhizobium sp.]|uniref:DUF6321 domain-containing protein n=1 Tax=uncultured Bradyrhizobium sp. TaxID=199684 RepID=UPI00261E22F5|nr:DUF6321 domain-containing protein [uncultured Bradyrhizobium sp.]